jgi:hypothetical protein
MALPVNSSELEHGKVFEWRNGMSKNGNPEPLFYTDGERSLFLVTLPCHMELKGTKSGTKSSIDLTTEDIDLLFSERFDIETLSNVLDYDITEISDHIRAVILSKSSKKMSKSSKKNV